LPPLLKDGGHCQTAGQGWDEGDEHLAGLAPTENELAPAIPCDRNAAGQHQLPRVEHLKLLRATLPDDDWAEKLVG
jgi:hypothetical protein